MTLSHRGTASRLFIAVLLAGALSSCSYEGGWESARVPAAPPPLLTRNSPAVPPSALDTIRTLLPPEGPRFTPLFSDRLFNADDRIKRLENAVQDVRNELDTVVPAMAHMVAIEHDNKVMDVQQQNLTAATAASLTPAALTSPVALTSPATLPAATTASPPLTSAPAASPAPAAAPVAEKKAVPPPPPETSAAGEVKALRFSDNEDKTRIVLDMTAKYDGAAKLENNGKTLVVPLPHLNWLGPQAKNFDSAQLISGYHLADGNLYIDLMYAAQIKGALVLQPESGNKDYRAVFDLFSSEIHKKQ